MLGVCVVGLGFYRGWFSLSSQSHEAGTNKVNLNLTVDPDKVKEDAAKVKEKTANLGNHAKENVTPINN